MKTTHINLSDDSSKGLLQLQGSGVPAVFSDYVRVERGGAVELFISGIVGTDASGKVVGRSVKEQTEKVLSTINEILGREGATFDHVVRVRVYLTQLDSQTLRDVHEVRSRFFTKGKYPASTLVRVSQLIPDGGLIEIDADAIIPIGSGD